MTRRALWAPLVLLGCIPQWSGASAPTQDTHPIAAEALEIASDDACDLELTGHDATDNAELRAKLYMRGVTIRERNRSKGSLVAFPFVLTMPRGFGKRPVDSQVRSLAHEDAHYCQRETFDDFDLLWLSRSDYRWAFETMAEGASWRAADGQGITITDEAMRGNATKMRETYWLFDLDETQFFTETMGAWKVAVIR